MTPLDDIVSYSRANSRVCPQPMSWNHLYEMLPTKTQKASGGWMPPLPLILAAWHEASDHDKAARLHEHLVWAEKFGVLEKVGRYLRGLQEEQWFHGND